MAEPAKRLPMGFSEQPRPVPLIFSPARPAGSRRGVGYWAFLLHRISGVVLALYLLFHLGFLSALYRGEAAYNAFLSVVTKPGMVYLDIALAAAAIYHAANGIRVGLLSMNIGTRRHAALFWVIFVLGLVALAFMGARMLAGE